jgi:NADH-quinone oxidoreductase subunit C
VSDDATTVEEERGRPDGTRHGVPVTRSLGQEVLHPERTTYLDVLAALRDEGYELFVDLTAVDYLLYPDRVLPEGLGRARFEVVVTVLDMERRERVRVRVQVPDNDPVLPTLWELYPGSEAYEREVFDMFGIRFDGHPDLTRILMPEDWEGHPLRKDYGMGRIPVQFKGAPN